MVLCVCLYNTYLKTGALGTVDIYPTEIYTMKRFLLENSVHSHCQLFLYRTHTHTHTQRYIHTPGVGGKDIFKAGENFDQS